VRQTDGKQSASVYSLEDSSANGIILSSMSSLLTGINRMAGNETRVVRVDRWGGWSGRNGWRGDPSLAGTPKVGDLRLMNSRSHNDGQQLNNPRRSYTIPDRNVSENDGVIHGLNSSLLSGYFFASQSEKRASFPALSSWRRTSLLYAIKFCTQNHRERLM
jgi:hypothetical protein